MKSLKHKGILLVLITAITFLIIFLLKNSSGFLTFYVENIYLPLQKVRSYIFNQSRFSFGDILYLFLLGLLSFYLIKLFYFLVKVKKYKKELLNTVLSLLTMAMVIVLVFVISWGGNYYRNRIVDFNKSTEKLDETALIKINHLLIERMNVLEQEIVDFPDIKEINTRANNHFKNNYPSKLPYLRIKKSSFTLVFNYLGIDGYYNPLSGESHINQSIPDYMYPFVACHELAHQIGIAAENDANIMAYYISMESNDILFQYSATFNAFLYAYSDLKRRMPELSDSLWSQLNLRSQNKYTELYHFYQQYRGKIRRFSNRFYNRFLKVQGQAKGIKSYSELSNWIYFWEIKNNKEKKPVVFPFE